VTSEPAAVAGAIEVPVFMGTAEPPDTPTMEKNAQADIVEIRIDILFSQIFCTIQCLL
jgi:hypothetical protein